MGNGQVETVPAIRHDQPRRRADGAERPTVLTLRAHGLGGFLTAVPAYRSIARAFPDHRLALAAPGALIPLARMTRALDALWDTPGLGPLSPRLAHIDVAIDLHGRAPDSHRLVADLAPARLITFTDPATPTPRFRSGPRWHDDEHEVRRWCRLLDESGIRADPDLLELHVPGGAPAPPATADATIVHPGAGSPSRRWPASRFAAVAAAEAASGRRVLVTAGPGERGLADRVVRCTEEVAGRTGGLPEGSVRTVEPGDLGRFAALVAHAGRVVCGDTGVAHLATAVRTPSVVLFGPVPPTRNGPAADRWWHVSLWAGRSGDPQAQELDPGLAEIGAADVLLALSRLPTRAPEAPGCNEAARSPRRVRPRAVGTMG